MKPGVNYTASLDQYLVHRGHSQICGMSENKSTLLPSVGSGEGHNIQTNKGIIYLYSNFHIQILHSNFKNF